MKTLANTVILLSLSSLLASCSMGPKPRIAQFKKASFTQIDGWDEDNHANALSSFKNSCDKIMNIDSEKNISRATKLGGLAIDWQVPCMEASYIDNTSDINAKKFFEKWFVPYKVFNEDWAPYGTITGYHHIELEGSKKKHGKYKYPIYRKPKNLEEIKGSSYIERSAINKGALSKQGLEVAYVDSHARLYSMQIQGSGFVKLKEGGALNLGFESSNGYRFKGIHQAIKDEELKFQSTQHMHNWLDQNPKHATKIFNTDPSYVFFKTIEGHDAIGGQGVPLKAERSLAIDYGLYPYGAPVWVSAKHNNENYNKLFIAQDTGGAIRGAIRGDVFFGRGRQAEESATSLKAKAEFFVLFPKTVKVPKKYSTDEIN